MAHPANLTVLVDNCANGIGLIGELGLAFWIETGHHRILFDTGQGMALEHNAAYLGVPLSQVDAVVLSHGHFDHTGGLAHVLQHGRNVTVYTHPHALAPKHVKMETPPHRPIGMPPSSVEALKKYKPTIEPTTSFGEIIPGVWVTGEIPRVTSYEGDVGPSYLDKDCTRPDTMADDQAMVLDTPQGLVILLGCAHGGVVNTLNYIWDYFGQARVHAVIGGMHLGNADDERLRVTGDVIEKMAVKLLAPIHCTGDRAKAYFWCRFPDLVPIVSAGTKMSF